jgi:DNA-binding protein HU-beta
MEVNKMTKNELVEFIAAKAGLTKSDANRALEATLEGIQTGLKKEGKVTLVGFGTFSAKKRAAREGINPLTKQPLKIAAKTVASFKAGSKLKDALN